MAAPAAALQQGQAADTSVGCPPSVLGASGAVITGLVEAFAALVGFAATSQMHGILPWTLALSGGAMLYVISNEMIPESHRKDFSQEATAGLLVGFVLMMFLDTMLG